MGVHWNFTDDRKFLPLAAFIPISLLFLIAHILFWVVWMFNEPWWDKASPSIATNQANARAWLFTVNSTLAGTEVEGKGLIKYGFGVWGWCEWGSTSQELQGEATCFGGGAWSIPGTAGASSRASNLDLPDALAKGMFPCGLIILFAILASMFLFVTHALTWRVSVQQYPPRFWSSYSTIRRQWNKFETVGYRYAAASILYSAPTFILVIALLLVGTIPTIACVELAKSNYSGPKGVGYFAARGLGYQLMIGALVTDLVALAIVGFVGYGKTHTIQRGPVKKK